jgi:hypothetical protein
MTFVLILALLAGTGYGAQTLLMTIWDRAVGYQSPYTADLAAPAGREPQALSPAVVLIGVDGLRVDASFTMESLGRLRAAGVSAVARTPEPSLSLPGAAALGTGAPPLIHGVTTNWYEGPIKVDSIFAAAHRAGLQTAFAGWDGWTQLFGEDIDRQATPHEEKDTDGVDLQVYETAREWLAAGAPPGLTVVYFSETDNAAHSYGGASSEYQAVVAQIDGYINDLLDLIDLSQATVIVTADHGHTDAGGHGGWEPEVSLVPLVIAGKGVKVQGEQWQQLPPEGYRSPAMQANASQLDVAPTIAALLGAPAPASALGIHHSEWLVADQTWLAQRLLLAAEARSRISSVLTGLGTGQPYPELLTQASAKITAGDPEGAIEAAADFLRAEETERSRVTASLGSEARAGRLPVALAAAVAPLLLLLLMARPPRAWVAWLTAALFLGAFYLLFSRIHGFQYSFSAFNQEDQIKAWIQARLVESAVLMIFAAVVTGFLTRDLDGGQRVTAGLGAVWSASIVVYLLGLNVLWFYYREGFEFVARLPDFRDSFRVLVYLLAAAGAGYAAVPGVLLALVAAGIGTRRRVAGAGRIYR